MAWTQAQVEALEVKIATAVRKVEYGDKSVTNAEIEQMMKALAVMKTDVAGSSSGRSTYAGFSSG